MKTAQRPPRPPRHCRTHGVILGWLAAGVAITGGAVAAAPRPFLIPTPGSAPEPYAPVHGGAWSGKPVSPGSPDPLAGYNWADGPDLNRTALQYYILAPVDASADAAPDGPRSAFQNVSSVVGVATGAGMVVAGPAGATVGSVGVTFDFGVETGSWLELDVVGLSQGDLGKLVLASGEANQVTFVGGYKRGTPKAYSTTAGSNATTLRLETNGELYEGMRYGFLNVTAPLVSPFVVTAVRAVVQVRPQNYAGSFFSAGDPLLEAVWWTGAFSIRTLATETYIGSVLVDRGDRISWTGDAFVSQGTMYAFAEDLAVLRQNLNVTSCPACCNGIATYCLYFVLSACEYLRQTNDTAGFAAYIPTIVTKLETAQQMYANPQGLRFVGWDDRTGSGFANSTTPETQNLYRMVAIRCWTEFATALNSAGLQPALAAKYSGYAGTAVAELRKTPGDLGKAWWQSSAFGVHAAADAINAEFTSQTEQEGIAAAVFSDIVALPSLSHFNQYFIADALGRMGLLDRGVESVREFWGADIKLGGTTFFEVGHPALATILEPGPPPLPAEQNGWTLLCADWSTGATQWLSRWVLGIRPLSAGYKTVLVAPHLGPRMGAVSGSIGTPHGPITLNVTRGEDAVAMVNVRLPASTSGRLQLSEPLLRRLGVLLPETTARKDYFGADNSTLAYPVLMADRHRQLEALLVTDISLGSGGPQRAMLPTVVAPDDTPLYSERVQVAATGGRSLALALDIVGGRTYSFAVSAGANTRRDLGLSSPPPSVVLPGREESPFPPRTFPGKIVGTDTSTQGQWVGTHGADGHVLFGFTPPPASSAFCATCNNMATMQLQCDNASATISKILFASYGTPAGTCPNFTVGKCAAANSTAILEQRCLGKHSCTIDADTPLFGDPCYGVGKTLAVVARCNVGGGGEPGQTLPPTDVAKLPSYIQSAELQTPKSGGFCGARVLWPQADVSDPRLLQDPAAPGNKSLRSLGAAVPHGCPTFIIDIVAFDQAKRWRLSAYFVDFGPAPDGSTGEPRSQEVYTLMGYPGLNPMTPRQYLSDFARGVWVTYEVVGDVRLRIATIRGDLGVLSAIAFDPAGS